MPDIRYTVVRAAPSVEDYRSLRAAAGLSERTEEARGEVCSEPCFAAQVFAGGTPVGTGRVVGDGGCFYQIVDIAVLSRHQGKGLGKRIMLEIMEFIEAGVPESAYISLIADGKAQGLCKQFGIQETAPLSVGMALKSQAL